MAKIKKREIKKINPVFADLRTPKYRKRVEVNKKGKGSYNRRGNNRHGDYSLVG